MTLAHEIHASQAFEDKLKRFETALEAPVVPGELEQWVTGVRDTAQEFADQLKQHLEDVHEKECQQIAKEDPEMMRHVKQLKQAGQESAQRMCAFLDHVAKLRRKAPRQEPAEVPLNGEIQRLSDDGLALVIHVRKQEVGRRTWLQEAFNRIRGDAD